MTYESGTHGSTWDNSLFWTGKDWSPDPNLVRLYYTIDDMDADLAIAKERHPMEEPPLTVMPLNSVRHHDHYKSELWHDDKVQFARLLCEMVANCEDLSFPTITASMDLETEQLQSLLERAHNSWKASKKGLY